MKDITQASFVQLQPWHGLVLVSILILALLGQIPVSQADWLTVPARVASLPTTFAHGDVFEAAGPKTWEVCPACQVAVGKGR